MLKKTCFYLIASYFLMSYCLIAIALRCGNQVIVLGDTPAKVKQYCGEPISYYTSKYHSNTKKNRNPGRQSVWTYNFGPNDFLYVLIFRNNQLSKIETQGYGY